MTILTEDPTLLAYERLAPFYDRYTDGYGHEALLSKLEAVAVDLGLRGSRLLDIGCGTGKSFMPMVERGYEVTAFDISPAMVERAREAARGTGAQVLVADARDFPVLGSFDFAMSVDDALNYVLSEDELGMVFANVARNLRPGGLFAFDLNTLRVYRHYFARDEINKGDGVFFCASGDAGPDAPPGVIATSVLEVFSTTDGECWQRTSSRHVQRHHPPELVERLLRAAGFDLLERRGLVSAAQLDRVGDEEQHMKLLYFARRAPTRADTDVEWR
jgi:SAM-dependent methyltransferase